MRTEEVLWWLFLGVVLAVLVAWILGLWLFA
jgi:hypothetical protein